MAVVRYFIRRALFAGTLALLAAGRSAAQPPAETSIDLVADGRHGAVTVRDEANLAPVLDRCLFKDRTTVDTLSPRAFALACVVPYIHGLWLDPSVLYRSKADIVAQATDKLIEHPAGEPFPIFYPSSLAERVQEELGSLLRDGSNLALKPLPDPLPRPSLDPESLYNNVGLLYLPNPYVVPGDTFNEMYGWDSFFIVKGLLASADFVMANPTALVWSPGKKSFIRLSRTSSDDNYYRAFAEQLFQTAKGMVDNHIFEITYYGGFILNANRTYYLTRSQPPLFTREAIAVLDSSRRYGFDYVETLAPYFRLERSDFIAPRGYADWIRTEVLPAARSYYAYWTDPTWTNPKRAQDGSNSNPRVANVGFDGATHPVYLFGTAGIGPTPEVAHSTQPQNRALYHDDADFFEKSPSANPDRLFYNPERRCGAGEPVGNCGDSTYGLTQAYYAADRAIRASGFDLSKRFGDAAQWAMHYAPISLNVLLLKMAEDIDLLSVMLGLPPPTGEAALNARRTFLAHFFKRDFGNGYADRFAIGEPPPDVPGFTYPYATQTYLLWADVLAAPQDRKMLVTELQTSTKGTSLLAPLTAMQFGIPTSPMDTGAQWDAPFAWAPIQYFAVDGLIAADFPTEANAVMQQWIAAANGFFAETGVLIEKYDVTNPTSDPRAKVGYAQTQRGFGWTNAVYMMFVNRLYLPL